MNKMKIFFSKLKITYLFLGLLLGLSISAGIILVKAAPAGESWATLDAGVSAGNPLTAAKWNGLVNQVNSLQQNVFSHVVTTTATGAPTSTYWTNTTGTTAFVMFSGSMNGNTENVYSMYINANKIGFGVSSSYNGSNGGVVSFPVPPGATCGMTFSHGGFVGTWYFTYWY